MGQSLGITGAALTVSGALLLGLTVISSLFGSFKYDAELIMTDNDFKKTNTENRFEASHWGQDLGSGITIDISSEQKNTPLTVMIIAPSGITEYTKASVTPFNNEIWINGYQNGNYIFVIILDENANSSFDQLDIYITNDIISDSSMYSCCMGMICGPVGGALFLSGLIILFIQLCFWARPNTNKNRPRYIKPSIISSPYDNGLPDTYCNYHLDSEPRVVKHIHGDANRLYDKFMNNGMGIPNKCPSCGGPVRTKNRKNAVCPYCGISIDFDTIRKGIVELLT